jgi:hypothetical protein
MKKQLLITGALAVIAAVFVPATTKGEIDLPYVNQRIDNLEARTTNNEADIKQLQDSTGTTPAPNRISVPATSQAANTVVTPQKAAAVSDVATPSESQPAPAQQPFTPYVTRGDVTRDGDKQRYTCAYHRDAENIEFILHVEPATADAICPAA